MKILIVNTFYYPNMQGGAEQSVKLLAEGLARAGNEVGVFCADSRDGKPENSELNGVHIYRRSTHNFDLFRFSYNKDRVGKVEKVQQKLLCYDNRKALDEFEKVCKEFQPELVHTNTTYGISALVWKRASRLGIPVIHTVRDIGIISPVQYGHKVSTVIVKAHQMYMRYATSFLNGVTAPSEYTLRTSSAIGTFKNVTVKKCIFNSVVVDRNKLCEAIEEKKKRTSHHIKFMYAGRLVYFKGIRQMMEAFKELNEPDSELMICGGGEMTEDVKRWAEEDHRIQYYGKLNNEELAQKYREADVLLVPSVWPEPFGRVLIEGNLYGLPVIAGNGGGMPEIIDTVGGGEMYEAEDAHALAEQMKNFMDRTIYPRYWDNMIKHLDVYSIDRQIESFQGIYRQLIHENRE